MPLATPFFKYYQKLKRNTVDGTGVTVWIVNIDNEKEEVGYSYRLPSHRYRYYGDYRFVDKYKDDLPTGGVIKWESRTELDMWINKQIYLLHQIYDSKFRFWFYICVCFWSYSACAGLAINYVWSCRLPNFVGVSTVWFSRVLNWNSMRFGNEFLPNGHEDLVQMKSGDYWILLKSGWRVFPVRVLNNRVDQGWTEFWVEHKPRAKFRLLFGAEQKWVFDVLVLDEQYRRVEYSWVSVEKKLDIESTTGG